MKSYHWLQKVFLNIQRAYCQCYIWVNLASNASVFLDLLCYDYYLYNYEKLVSDITSSGLPINFPLPCTRQKCAWDTVCLCRIKSIDCYEYCKCVKTDSKNSKTIVLPCSWWSYSVLCSNNLQTSQVIVHIYFASFEQLRQPL